MQNGKKAQSSTLDMLFEMPVKQSGGEKRQVGRVLLEAVTGDKLSTVVLPDVLNEESKLYHKYNNKRLLYYQVFLQGLGNETLSIGSNSNCSCKVNLLQYTLLSNYYS